jgi:hypothetical protein
MTKGSTKVNLYNQEYEMIKEAANSLGVPMSKILKDYAISYLKLHQETRNFNNDSSVIRDLLSQIESRISSVVLDNSDQVRKNYLELKNMHHQLQIIAAIFDNFIKFYLNHTPEVPFEKRAEILQNSLSRYERFITATGNGIEDGDAKIISQIKNLIN